MTLAALGALVVAGCVAILWAAIRGAERLDERHQASLIERHGGDITPAEVRRMLWEIERL